MHGRAGSEATGTHVPSRGMAQILREGSIYAWRETATSGQPYIACAARATWLLSSSTTHAFAEERLGLY